MYDIGFFIPDSSVPPEAKETVREALREAGFEVDVKSEEVYRRGSLVGEEVFVVEAGTALDGNPPTDEEDESGGDA